MKPIVKVNKINIIKLDSDILKAQEEDLQKLPEIIRNIAEIRKLQSSKSSS